MPFNYSLINLFDSVVEILPDPSFPWGFSAPGLDFDEIVVINHSINAILVSVLFDENVLRAGVAKCNLNFKGVDFIWCAFVPRAIDCVDLKKTKLTCNVNFFLDKPFINGSIEYPEMGHISSKRPISLQGVGYVKLC